MGLSARDDCGQGNPRVGGISRIARVPNIDEVDDELLARNHRHASLPLNVLQLTI